ncbi:uncharacterized protein LOC143817947 [Ranitomeya variabilis]|uniref:uncharacterized protein LOC143817947 n=1 Tax=Ranitomeya variabilis TaxID=490064 RepID=UPI004056CF0B
MEMFSVSDFVSAYSKFTQEAIEEYVKKNNTSSISVEDLKLINPRVATYCLDKMTEQLYQDKELNVEDEIRQDVPKGEKDLEQGKCKESALIHQSSVSEDKELNNEDEIVPDILKNEKDLEQEKCKELAPIHQSSVSEVKELNTEDEIGPEIPKEEKYFEQEKCKEPAPIHQSSTSEICVELFMKFMTEHHKQQQEYQNIVLNTFLDQMKHQHTQEEQRQQQQNRFHEQVLHQQQDFQSRLMGDFMKHSEMQTTLLCQALSNCKIEQSHQDNHLNKDIKGTPCNESPSPKMAKNFNGGDNSFSGRTSAKKMESFSHSQVSKREKQPFQLFDCHKLGQDFCQWFFPLLNSQNPAHGQERLAWDPQMFWNDVTFLIRNENSLESYTGDECVNSKLFEMMQEEKLTFTPVLDSERFKCANSRHGLVVVAVTGIMSRTDKCSSVFNQIFGLIKCPSTDKYKIKSMNLKVDNMNYLSSLHNVPVPPLEYTSEQLQDFHL